jgi:hypothetical protein
MLMRTALFWGIVQRQVVILNAALYPRTAQLSFQYSLYVLKFTEKYFVGLHSAVSNVAAV